MTQDFAKLFQSMMEQGQTMARAFTPSAFGTIDPKAFEAMFPAMPKDMLEMFFGKTFNPEGLDARTRFLVTIAAQTVLGPLGEPQLRPTVRNALAAGANGYMLKQTKPLELLESIRELMNGGAPMTRQIAAKVVSSFRKKEQSRDPLVESLSNRELEILDRLVKGMLYKEIGMDLHISTETVRKHVYHIYKKLHVNNRVEAYNKFYGNNDMRI